MSLPYPTPVSLGRRDTLPLKGARLEERCEDCLTTTLTRTLYVDEYGQSTTCLTTQYQTTFQTSTIPPTPTTTLTGNGPYQTVYQTMTSTISAAQPIAASSPSGGQWQWPPPLIEHASRCLCEEQWVKVFLGGLPHGAAEIMACLAFFFPLLFFFLVTMARLVRYGADKEIFFILVPLTIFLATMVAALPTRAYAANNDSSPHFLAQHVMISLAVPVLTEVALQLYGLLAKRAIPSGWIDSTSIFFRLVNIISLILYAVAAGSFVTFVNDWSMGRADCTTADIRRIHVLNIVADILELLLLVAGGVCLFFARWKLRMQTGVLVIQWLIFGFLSVHFTWRFLHDINGTNAWNGRLDRTCSLAASVSPAAVDVGATIDWRSLRQSASSGIDSSAPFWLLAILPVFLAAILLMAANLCLYVSSVPQPIPEADSVRYKLCYNEDTKKMEFQRLDNPGNSVLPSGEQLYELVRDHDGDGWAVREAKIPTVLPSWHNVTLRPWYK